MKAVLLNDTRRVPEHLGTALVMKSLVALCEKNDIEIIDSIRDINPEFSSMDYLERIREADCLIINGEGTLHDDHGPGIYRRVKLARQHKKAVHLINAVWQDNPESKKHLYLFDRIFVRESLSCKQAVADGADPAVVRVTPDLSFYGATRLSGEITTLRERKPLLIVDSVIRQRTLKLARIALSRSGPLVFMAHSSRNRFFRRSMHWWYLNKIIVPGSLGFLESLEQLSSYDWVVSGRFHADCLAMALGVPCLALTSNTHKVDGLYADAGLLELEHYCVDGNAEYRKIQEAVDRFLDADHTAYRERSAEYVARGVEQIEEMFRIIRDFPAA